MPGFDGEIAKMANRLLINPRSIDYHTGVLATKVTPGVPGNRILTLPRHQTVDWMQESSRC